MAESKSSLSRKSTATKSPVSRNAPPPPRRSRSVSAVPRTSSDFVFKVENPLYCASPATSPPEENTVNKDIVAIHSRRSNSISKSAPLGNYIGNPRGRPMSRSHAGETKDVVSRRSLSRTPAEIPQTQQRSRSVSRGPVSRGTPTMSYSENEMKRDSRNRGKLSRSNDAGNSGTKGDLATRFSRSGSDWSSSNLSSPHTLWDDDVVRDFLESEDRSIRPAHEAMTRDALTVDSSNQIYETVRSEVRRAIADIQDDLQTAVRRSNSPSIVTPNVADISPDFVNSSAVELVLDIRREYASKLEQSQERASKLRADLAVEEHRGLELSRILEEVLPHPKTSNLQKSRLSRKLSIEKKRMSKQLTEDALAYFDECVSLSTFDSSDFSSPEDFPVNVITTNSLGDNTSTTLAKRHNHWDNKPECGNILGSPLSAASISKDQISMEHTTVPPETHSFKSTPFSLYGKRDEIFNLQQEICNYVKNTSKEVVEDNSCFQAQHLNHFDIDEYILRSQQNMWSDRLQFKNRIQSGSMLICGCGSTFL